MKKIGLLAVSLALICIAAGIAGCTTQNITGSAGADQADVIRLAGGDYGYPQPFTIYPRGPGSSKVRMIFDSLIEKDEEGLIPWLAETWDISPDGRVRSTSEKASDGMMGPPLPLEMSSSPMTTN